MEEVPVVVMDIGMASIRAGFAGEEAPRWSGTTLDRMPSGPLAETETVNWDAYERLVAQAFSRMDVSPREVVLFVILLSQTPRAYLEKITQIAFETFWVPAFSIQIQATAVLTLQGASTGVVVYVGAGRVQVTPLFQGSLQIHAILGENYGGEQQLATLIYDAVMKNDFDFRFTLFGNIVLVGEVDGKLSTPVKDRIKTLVPPNTVVNLTSPANPQNAAWLGGSIRASNTSAMNASISREEYDEYGPSIVHRKCPM